MASVIGEPLNRVDGRLKVTGKAPYTADQIVPGVVHAILITSTIAKGTISSMDTTAAQRVPGVLAIFTHKSGLRLAKNPMEVQAGTPADRALQLLQDNQVRYGNQPIGIAVAETIEAAREAAALVRVEYLEQRPSIRFEDGLASAYIPVKAGGAQDPGQSHRGDVETGLQSADQRQEEIYGTAFHTHNPMEPHATIAVWDGPGREGAERLTLYDSSQGIFGDRKRVADLLGLQPDNVRVISLFLGGGFGSKGPSWSHVLLCAMAARQVRRPVKLVLQRPQMFGPVGCRTETRQTIAVGAKRDGTLTALRNETLSHTSTFDEFTETATLPTRMLYSAPNNSTVQKLVRSDMGTPSYTRAPGEAPGTFALEIAMDEMAYRLGIDPLEFRLKNYADHDEDKNLPWSTKSLRECYRAGADRFGWSSRRMQPRSLRDGHTLIGWGMATSVYPARRSPCSARARLYANGTVVVDAGTQDLGGGTYTVMTQIAAAALGVPVSLVSFHLGDTRYPETPVSGGSQTAASAGSAVDAATKELRRRILDFAGAADADLIYENNRLAVKTSNRNQAVADLMMTRGQPFLEGFASTSQPQDAKQFSSYSFGAQFAEVRVDADLGQIRVSRMVGAFAAGTILNEKLARSQFIGGMIWGISLALLEDTVYDPRMVRVVNNNLAEYHVPVNADVGDIDVIMIPENDPHVSFTGSKGIGEIGITGSAASIANAVYHATGRRVREAPITLDQLL